MQTWLLLVAHRRHAHACMRSEVTCDSDRAGECQLSRDELLIVS
jgi:hypothetical protein